MFVENAWHVVGFSDDFVEGELKDVMLLGEPVVIVRTADGLVALENRCVHRFAPLSAGRCEGVNIRCMYHGMLFAPDGRCLEIPGQSQVPAKARVRSYAIAEQGGWVLVWGGDAHAADPSLLPYFHALDDPSMVWGKGSLHYEAANHLVNANLLDFTHTAYVHCNSFGSDEVWLSLRANVSPIENGVRVKWWIPEEKVSEPGAEEIVAMDTRHVYDYLVPGILIMRTNYYPLGTAARADGGEADCEPLFHDLHGQAVTALTAETSRYFFSWGIPAETEDADRAIAMRMTMAGMAFAEDKLVIEGQQKIVAATPPGRHIMPTTGDNATVLFERIMARRDADHLVRRRSLASVG